MSWSCTFTCSAGETNPSVGGAENGARLIPAESEPWDHSYPSWEFVFSPSLTRAEMQIEWENISLKVAIKETLLEWTFWPGFIKHEYGYLVVNRNWSGFRRWFLKPLPSSNIGWCYREISRLLPGLLWVCGWRNLITKVIVKCCTYKIQGRSACINSVLNRIFFVLEESGLLVFSFSLLDCCRLGFISSKKEKKKFFPHQCYQPQIFGNKKSEGVFSSELSFS